MSAELGRLDRWQSAVFAASCAEVLFPSYARFVRIEEVGDADFVRSTLDAIWARLEAGHSDVAPDASLPTAEDALRLLPEEEDWNDWAPQAENAIGALGFALGILHGSASASAADDAAYQAYEAADELANRHELGDEDEDDVMEPTVVEDEVERQEEAVRILRQGASGEASLVQALRDAARRLALGGAE